MQPTALTFWTVAEAAAEALPELRAELEALVLESFAHDQRPYPHWVLEQLLLPYVNDRVQAGDAEALAGAFAFVETLARHPDTDLVEVVGNSFLEFLDADTLRAVEPYLGDATRAMARAWCNQVPRHDPRPDPRGGRPPTA